MKNLPWDLSQSETEKYFEWILNKDYCYLYWEATDFKNRKANAMSIHATRVSRMQWKIL